MGKRELGAVGGESYVLLRVGAAGKDGRIAVSGRGRGMFAYAVVLWKMGKGIFSYAVVLGSWMVMCGMWGCGGVGWSCSCGYPAGTRARTHANPTKIIPKFSFHFLLRNPKSETRKNSRKPEKTLENLSLGRACVRARAAGESES